MTNTYCVTIGLRKIFIVGTKHTERFQDFPEAHRQILLGHNPTTIYCEMAGKSAKQFSAQDLKEFGWARIAAEPPAISNVSLFEKSFIMANLIDRDIAKQMAEYYKQISSENQRSIVSLQNLLDVNEQGLSDTRAKLLSIETEIKILTDSEQFLETAQKHYEHREWQQKLLILLEEKFDLYRKKKLEASESLLFCSLNVEAESYDNTLKSKNPVKYQVITNLLDQMNSNGVDALVYNLVIMSGRPKQSIDSGIIDYITQALPNCQVIGLENEHDRARAIKASSYKPQPYSPALIEFMMNQITQPEEEKMGIFESFKAIDPKEPSCFGIDRVIAIRNKAWFDTKLEASMKSTVESAENIIIVVGDAHAQGFYGILAKIKELYKEATITILDQAGITHPYDHINTTPLIQEVSAAAAASGESLSASEDGAEFEAQADLVPTVESNAGGLVKLDFDTH